MNMKGDQIFWVLPSFSFQVTYVTLALVSMPPTPATTTTTTTPPISPASIRVSAASHVRPLSSSCSPIRSFCLHGCSVSFLPLFRPQRIDTRHSPAGEHSQLLLPVLDCCGHCRSISQTHARSQDGSGERCGMRRNVKSLRCICCRKLKLE